MRGASLRSRLFQAIGVVVIICIALTIGVGLLLTRRAVENAALQDVATQADLIANAQSNSGVTILIPDALTEQHEQLVRTRNPVIVPEPARSELKRSTPAHPVAVGGTLIRGGINYYYAARFTNPGYIVLLRPASRATSLL